MSSKKRMSSTKSESTSALVPKLRFPEFKGQKGWIPARLEEIATPVTERAVRGSQEVVLSLSADHGIIRQSEFFGKKVAGDDAQRYLKISHNDFVYNDRTTKASTFGTIKRLSKHSSGIVSPIYKCFRFHDSENPIFWEQYFESGKHAAALSGLVNEGARAGRFNISITQFLSTVAFRPQGAEQNKIADCLTSLDNLISSQARKVDLLKKYKKGLLQQLFPREGETEPRLRFPEFRGTGAWERKAMGSIASFSSGGTPSKDNPTYWNGSIPWISASSMYDLFVTKADYYVTQLAIGNGTRVAKKGSILILVRGSMLFKRVPICLASVDVTFNQDVKALEVDSSVDTVFLLYQLLAFQSRLQVTETGIGAGKLELDQLKGFELVIPKTNEQQRIASFFSRLESELIAETNKYEALRTHKNGLINALFPVVEI